MFGSSKTSKSTRLSTSLPTNMLMCWPETPTLKTPPSLLPNPSCFRSVTTWMPVGSSQAPCCPVPSGIGILSTSTLSTRSFTVNGYVSALPISFSFLFLFLLVVTHSSILKKQTSFENLWATFNENIAATAPIPHFLDDDIVQAYQAKHAEFMNNPDIEVFCGRWASWFDPSIDPNSNQCLTNAQIHSMLYVQLESCSLILFIHLFLLFFLKVFFILRSMIWGTSRFPPEGSMCLRACGLRFR